MKELRSCPFCGGEAYLMPVEDGRWVECEKCGAETGFSETAEDAIEAWNKRVQ